MFYGASPGTTGSVWLTSIMMEYSCKCVCMCMCACVVTMFYGASPGTTGLVWLTSIIMEYSCKCVCMCMCGYDVLWRLPGYYWIGLTDLDYDGILT